jgi:DNA-binding NarL/FixJ family response regulator
MSEVPQMRADRIGVVATDPLRILGLRVIFNESMQTEIVPLSIPGALDDANLCLVLIDADCTTHLIELITTFRKVRPSLKLIVLGGDTSGEFIESVIGAGAKGFLPLTAAESEIRMAIDTVRDGSVWAPRKILARLLDRQRSSPGLRAGDAMPRFTAREHQILVLLHQGQSNREIAQALGIDEGTVKAHMGRLMRKVGVDNRIALTIHPFTHSPSVLLSDSLVLLHFYLKRHSGRSPEYLYLYFDCPEFLQTLINHPANTPEYESL